MQYPQMSVEMELLGSVSNNECTDQLSALNPAPVQCVNYLHLHFIVSVEVCQLFCIDFHLSILLKDCDGIVQYMSVIGGI